MYNLYIYNIYAYIYINCVFFLCTYITEYILLYIMWAKKYGLSVVPKDF